MSRQSISVIARQRCLLHAGRILQHLRGKSLLRRSIRLRPGSNRDQKTAADTKSVHHPKSIHQLTSKCSRKEVVLIVLRVAHFSNRFKSSILIRSWQPVLFTCVEPRSTHCDNLSVNAGGPPLSCMPAQPCGEMPLEDKMRNTASTRPDLIDSPAAIATEERPRIVPTPSLEPGLRRPPHQGITRHPWVRSVFAAGFRAMQRAGFNLTP